MKLIKRIAALMMVLCLALSLVGCGDTTWILKVNGETVPSGLYIYYQTEGYGDAMYNLYQEDSSYLYQYLYFYNYNYVMPEMFEVALSDGKTVEEHMNDYALSMCKQAVVVDALFEELGLTVSPEDKDLIDTRLRNEWSSNSERWEKSGVSRESLRLAIESSFKEDAVFDAYYEIGGLNGTTEEEIEQYFGENYARVKYMTFTFADNIDDAVDEARKNEQLDLANSYLERAQAGEAMDDLIEEYNAYLEEQNAEDTDETADDTVDSIDNDDTADTDETEETEETEDGVVNAEIVDPYANESVISKESTYPTEKFISYVFNNCNVGEVSVIQDDLCFYVVERLDVLERTDLYDTYRDNILYELFDNDYTKLINDRLAGYEVVENAKSVKRYTAKKAFPDAEEAQ